MTCRVFYVAPEIFVAFPGMRLVVATVERLDNTVVRPSVERAWIAAWESVGKDGLYDAREHPFVKAWRNDFATQGVSMKRFPTSVEALMRRALKGGVPFSINPLVDFYNSITLSFSCPAGAFDIDMISERIELRRTGVGDCFQSLDSSEIAAVPPNEIAYASGTQVLTRHFMWRQSKFALVTPQTQTVFLVAEVPSVAGKEMAHGIETAFADGLHEHFGCTTKTFILDEKSTEIDW